MTSTGEYHHWTVEIAAKRQIPLNGELVRETARRLIEEVVELGLSAGLNAGDILAHVADGLHNEARKTTKHLYPSELGYKRPDFVNLPVEIVDVDICLDYLRFAARISQSTIDEMRSTKLELLRMRAEAGAYTMVGLRIYKKEARA